MSPDASIATVETIDVSRPRPSTWTEKAAGSVSDLGLAVLLVLAFPLGLIIIGAPLVLLVRAVLALIG